MMQHDEQTTADLLAATTDAEAPQTFRELLDVVFNNLKPQYRPLMAQAAKLWLADTVKDADFALHNGQVYHAITGGTAKSTYVEDRHATEPGRRGEVDYAFVLFGAHDGPELSIWMINPREEPDEGIRGVAFDRLVWRDTEDALPDFLTEAYQDEMLEHLRIIASESWS